jgi:hypothetical protein
MGRANAYREKVRESLTEVTVPSGAVFTVRDFNPEGWLMTGCAPESIVQTFLEVQKKGELGMEQMLTEPGTFPRLGELMKHAIAYCAVDPVVKIAGATEDELAADEMLFGDIQHLWMHITKQLPTSTVRTETEEVSAEAVHTFRQGE